MSEYSCEARSAEFYGCCALGGLLSCGITHTAVMPLDLVKCRLQTDYIKTGIDKNLRSGIKLTIAEDGARGLVKGWAPTMLGYSLQGLWKFCYYEVFKIVYSGVIGEEAAYNQRILLYLASSASAELFACIYLAPFETMKVRIQTMPGYANNMREAYAKMSMEGGSPFFKILKPLWMRQVPYTMVKFSTFEKTTELLWANAPKPRSECTKDEQLVITFVAGYIAGIFCAIISNPADCIVSALLRTPGSTHREVLMVLGWRGLWASLGSRMIMIGPLSAFQWLIYDWVKIVLRVPRPPPPTMPESLRLRLEKEGKL